MHPNPAFQRGNRAWMEKLIDQIGFGMVFCTTPDGPRIAHTPMILTDNGNVQFHLARGNALSRHLCDTKALIVVNGPDAYISARWYEELNQVPTWNYVSVELEGIIQKIGQQELEALLEKFVNQHEKRVTGGIPWSMDKLSADRLKQLLESIYGFEMNIQAWRETLKLSQNKTKSERHSLRRGLEAQGSSQMADLMRENE